MPEKFRSLVFFLVVFFQQFESLFSSILYADTMTCWIVVYVVRFFMHTWARFPTLTDILSHGIELKPLAKYQLAKSQAFFFIDRLHL